jgi:hypothetical protein
LSRKGAIQPCAQLRKILSIFERSKVKSRYQMDLILLLELSSGYRREKAAQILKISRKADH